MAKPRLEEMRIRPAANGSHHVVHSFASTPKLAKGALSGGMTMASPPNQEFNFGPKDGGSLLKHIASTLALKGLPAGGPPAAGTPQPGAED